MKTSELSVGGGASMESSDFLVDEKDSNAGKIAVAVVLLLLALIAGTYAFVDMTQQKLDRASGEGAGYQVTLHDIYEPADAVDWKKGVALDKKVYVSAHDDSQPAVARVRLFEYLGLGDDFPYTSVRFVTNDAKTFINVDGGYPVANALAAFNLDPANAKHIGKAAVTTDDIYWLQTKLNQAPAGAGYDTTIHGGWFLKSAGLGGTSTTAADNGQLGAYLQYRGFVEANADDGPTPNLAPNQADLTQATNFVPAEVGKELDSLVQGTAQGGTADATEMDVSNNDVTVGLGDLGYSTDADAEAFWHGYVPVAPTNPVSEQFRKYIQIDWSKVQKLSTYDGAKGVWVLDDGNEDGWFYYISDNESGLIENGDVSEELLGSITLKEQPTKAFVYSQYVSMDARDCSEIWEDAPATVLAALDCGTSTEPKITSVSITLQQITLSGKNFGELNEFSELLMRFGPGDDDYMPIHVAGSGGTWEDKSIVVSLKNDEYYDFLGFLSREALNDSSCQGTSAEGKCLYMEFKVVTEPGETVWTPFYFRHNFAVLGIWGANANTIKGIHLFSEEIATAEPSDNVTLESETWTVEYKLSSDGAWIPATDDIKNAVQFSEYVFTDRDGPVLKGLHGQEISWTGFDLPDGATILFTNAVGESVEYDIPRSTRAVISNITAEATLDDGAKFGYKITGKGFGDVKPTLEDALDAPCTVRSGSPLYTTTDCSGVTIITTANTNDGFAIPFDDVLSWSNTEITFRTDFDILALGIGVQAVHSDPSWHYFEFSETYYPNFTPFITEFQTVTQKWSDSGFSFGEWIKIVIQGDPSEIDELGFDADGNQVYSEATDVDWWTSPPDYVEINIMGFNTEIYVDLLAAQAVGAQIPVATGFVDFYIKARTGSPYAGPSNYFVKQWSANSTHLGGAVWTNFDTSTETVLTGSRLFNICWLSDDVACDAYYDSPNPDDWISVPNDDFIKVYGADGQPIDYNKLSYRYNSMRDEQIKIENETQAAANGSNEISVKGHLRAYESGRAFIADGTLSP
ncbi:hypothetical protein FACS1894125_0220 [Actinomycetota bacterium]|nr:hypothetical protein FACS1894125_0220 [Actinomycetota bacterium]